MWQVLNCIIYHLLNSFVITTLGTINLKKSYILFFFTLTLSVMIQKTIWFVQLSYTDRFFPVHFYKKKLYPITLAVLEINNCNGFCQYYADYVQRELVSDYFSSA